MSFKAPFNDPKDGDFIYGLKSNRSSYLTGMKFKGKSILMIDNYEVIEADKNRVIATSKNDELQMHYEQYKATPAKDNDNAQTRRKCKAGLKWIVEEKKTVHFVLDGIDFDKVVDKTEADCEDRAVTGAELRWVYRNMDLPGVSDYVQFWYSREQVPPPWETALMMTIFGPTGIIREEIPTKKWDRYVPKS